MDRASPEVRAFNNGTNTKPGLFKPLLAVRSHKMIFFAIIVFFSVAGFVGRFSGNETERGVTLGGNVLALTIYPVDETHVLGIVKNIPRKGEFYSGMVYIAVSPVMSAKGEGEGVDSAEPLLFTHRVMFNMVESEFFQVSLPFDSNDYYVLLKTDNEQKSLRLGSGGNRK